jgi:hypothetical protein
MTGEHYGNPDCAFSQAEELALASEVMSTIKSYSERERSEPCPQCLRNTMLAVAALLHLEAAKLEAASTGRTQASGKSLGDAFAKVARERLDAVTKAEAAIIRPDWD